MKTSQRVAISKTSYTARRKESAYSVGRGKASVRWVDYGEVDTRSEVTNDLLTYKRFIDEMKRN